MVDRIGVNQWRRGRSGMGPAADDDDNDDDDPYRAILVSVVKVVRPTHTRTLIRCYY